MAASDHVQPRLFDVPESEPVDVTHKWAGKQQWWHASNSPRLDNLNEGTLHVGTDWAAADRSSVKYPNAEYFHPVNLAGQMFTPADAGIEHEDWRTTNRRATGDSEHEWGDDAANQVDRFHPSIDNEYGVNTTTAVGSALEAGHNIPYTNRWEDAGSTSVRAPQQNVETWKRHVLRNWYTTSTPEERKAVHEGWDLHYRIPQIAQQNAADMGVDLTPDEAIDRFKGSPEGLTASEIPLGYRMSDPKGDAWVARGADEMVPEWTPPAKKTKKAKESHPQFPGMEDY